MVFSQILKSCRHNPRRITKADKDFGKRIDFKDIKHPVKIRDVHKIGKKSSISIFVFGYENKEKYPICVYNVVKKKNWLIIDRRRRRNTRFMVDHLSYLEKFFFVLIV